MRNPSKPSRTFYGLLTLLLLALGGLACLLGHQEKERKACWQAFAFLPEGMDRSPELEEKLPELPGLLTLMPICKSSVNLHIEEYETTAELYGISFEGFPVSVAHSFGAAARETGILLAAGNEVMASLTDLYETRITENALAGLMAETEPIEAWLEMGEEGQEEALLLAVTGEKGIADRRLYGEYEGVLAYLEQEGTSFSRGYYLEIQGTANAEAVRHSLEKAGFLWEPLLAD